jgi:hypothetical protein
MFEFVTRKHLKPQTINVKVINRITGSYLLRPTTDDVAALGWGGIDMIYPRGNSYR